MELTEGTAGRLLEKAHHSIKMEHRSTITSSMTALGLDGGSFLFCGVKIPCLDMLIPSSPQKYSLFSTCREFACN